MRIVIDPADPTTPTDPARHNERYRTTLLVALATDEAGKPQPGLDVFFAASAGLLSSGGATRQTDAEGTVRDTLAVYETDPNLIEVAVKEGDRVTRIVVAKIVAEPPVANAGPDQVVECTGDSSAAVTLDAAASTDPNNDMVLYEWYEHYGTDEKVLLGTGKSLTLRLPVGEHTITLRVEDSTAKQSTDEVVVKVVDTRPPIVRLNVTPSSLWPPNHKMVLVHANLSVDECGPFTVHLVSVTSNEPDNGLGDGDTAGDIQGVDTGRADYDFGLRAERAGGGSGRVYTVVYRVVDAGGLETTARARVIVKHDQGR